jgi:hypothetical protein
MTTEDITARRPGMNQVPSGKNVTVADPQERLRTLYARWDQFSGEYQQARARGDQETMTNLRGLMLLIKREIKRLGGELRDFPYPDGSHLSDL